MGERIAQLDRLLRGESTRIEDLREGRINVRATELFLLIVGLGVLYGLCMGAFALIRTWGQDNWMSGVGQMIASGAKVPLLFLLTLAVTFPSLYVFNALVGSRLTVQSVLRLITAAIAVMLAVLASFGTIVAFFSFTTNSYPFMLVLNVAMFTICGVLGLAFLLRTLHRLTIAQEHAMLSVLPADTTAPREQGTSPPPALPPGALTREQMPAPARVRVVFRIWVVVFALVGAQMAWVLRPFVGDPAKPFEWFRGGRSSNFFEGLFNAVRNLFA